MSINAVKIQMYFAIITYCLIAIIGNKLKVDCKIYELKIDGVKFYKFLASLYWIKLLINEIFTKYGYK